MPIIEDLKQKDEERKKSTQYSFDPVPVPSKKVNGTVSFKSSDSSDQATQYSQDPLDYVTSLHFTRNGTTYDISSDAAKTLANGYLYKSKSDSMWAVQAQAASTDSYTDAVLKKWGIPSAASLDDLIEYSGGGSVPDVYGGVSENQWSKIREMWSKEWKYDATDVDAQRQSQGLAPSSFDSQYENTLLDAQLKEMGLPPSALISKTYANEYNIWVGNDETWNDIMYDAAELVSKSTDKPQESEGGLLSNATNAAFEDATIAPITFDEAIKQVIASNPEYAEFVGDHLGAYIELPDRDDEKYILKDQYGLDVGFDSAAYNKDLQAAIAKNAKLQGDEFALTAEGFDEYYAGKYAEIKYDEALKTEALTVTADELFTAESLEGMDAPTRAKADEYAATATEILASQGFDAFIKYVDEDIPASVQANNDAFTGAIEASAFSASPTEAVSVLKDYYIGYGYDEEKATELAQSAYADTNYAYVYGLNASEIEQVRGGADVATIVTAKLSTEEGKQEYSTIRAECYFGALYGMSQKEIQAQIDSWTATKAGISSAGDIPQDASGWGGYVDNRNQSGSTPAGEAAWRAAAAEYTTGTTRDDDGTPHTANEKAQWARNEAQTKIDYYTDMMNAYNALQSSYYYATLKENDDFESESKCETGYSDIEDDSVNPIPTLGALQTTLYVYANNCTRYASDGSAHGGTSGKIGDNEPPINLDDNGYIVLGDVAERGKTCMELAKYLSDDELAMYNYLWNTQGAEKASAYFGKLLPTLDSRAVKRGDETAEEFAAAHPFWASVFSVPVGMAEGVISFVKSTSTRIDNAISSRDGASIALRESQLPNSSDVWRSTVSQKLGEHGWGAAYQLGMSLADSAAIIGLTYATGGIAGAAFGAGSTAASTAANVASWVGTSALGAKAFNSTLHDGLERGLSDDAAYKTALAAGIFETLFEKVSLDVFTSGMGGFAAVKQAIAGKTRAESVALIAKYVLETQAVQSFTEASEELNTELANVLYDFIANGDMNEYEQRAAYLMSDEGGGLSREEAYAQADKEMTDRFVQAGAGGAISGFIMGGGGAIISSMTGTYGTQNRLQAVSETVKNTSAITAKDATTFVRQNGQFVDGEITVESAIDVFNKLYDKGADSATIQSVKQAITTEKTSDDVFNAIESVADKAQARTRNALVNSYRKAGLAKGVSRSRLESEIQSYLNGVDYAVKASDVASIDTAVAAVKNGELERVVEKLNNSRAKKASGMSNAGAVSTSTRHVQSLVKNGTISAESTDVTRKLFATRKQSGATTTLSTAFAADAALLTQYAGQADFSGVAAGKDAASLSNAAKTGAVKSLASENGDATRLLMHEASGDALNGRVPAITALCGEDGDAGAFAAAVIAIASNSQTGDARAAIYKQMTERGYSSSLMSLLTYAVLSKGQSADGNSGIMTLSQVSELTAEIGKQQEAAANAKASLEATQADISTSETEAEAKVKRHEATRDAFEPTAENAEKIANANAEVNNAASALDNLRSENAKRLATTKKESNAAVKSANAKIKKARAKLATHSAQYVSLFSSDIYAMQNGRAINRASIDARTKALESYSMTEQEQADRRVIDEEKRRVQRFAMATGAQIEVVAFDDAFAKSHPFSESTPFDADAYGVTIDGSIYLNEAKIDPHEPNALRIAMAHELTHYLERDAATYKQLCDFVRSTIGSEYDACVSEITDYYASRGINLDRAHAEREIVAYFASETLLQSPSAIASLVETNRPVANRFMGWLNGVLEKVGRYDADKMITRGVALYKNALNAASAHYSFDNIAAGAAQADEDASVPKSRKQRVAATTDNTATSVKSETPVQDVAPEQAETASQNADAPVIAEEPTHETQDVQTDKPTQAPVQEQSDVAQQPEQTDGEYYVQTQAGAKPVTGTMRDGFGYRTVDGQIEVTLLDTGAAVRHAATVEEAIAYVDEHKAELIASQQTEEAQRKAANFRELRDASLQYRGQAAPATARRQRNTSLRDAIDTPIDAETADIQYSFGTDAGYIRNSLKEMDSDYNELAKKYDPNSSTNDSALVREELNGMVNAAANANGFEYRRCSKKKLNASNDVPLMMFSEQNDFEGLHIFGDHRYVATGKGALEIADVYDEISNLYEQYFGTDAREDDINPKDIVDSAGIWDNAGFVQFVWDNYFEQVYEKTGAVPAVALSDGLVVLGEDNSRIKSADPVVYDDAGNIIPLSERFNSSEPDIRWYNGFDYNGMLEKYGVIENFSRRPVPKKTSETKTTSKSAQKVADSYVLSDKQHEDVFKPLVASEAMSYVPVANNKTLAAATTRANANTLAENIVLLRDMAESGRTNAEDGAFAQLLIQRAAQSGTQEELEAALAYSSIISVEAGRSLQIQSLLKRMSPNGKLRYMESIIGKINAKYATKLKQPYELTTAERNALLNSNSQEESDTIIEQISKRIGETLPLTFGDRIKAWRYFSMLSSAKTHLRNIMGNTTMASMYNVSDAMGAAVESAAVRAGAMTQDERTRAVFSRALHKDVVDYSKAAFDERQGSLAQGSKFVDKGFGVEKYKRMFDWKPLDKAAKGVFNLLEKEDQFFMKKRFVSVMSQMIVARGYDVNNITDEQRAVLVQQASEEALKATFRDASKVADVLTEASKIKGVGLLVEGIIPFKKTPINVLKRGVDFSALGLLRGIYDVSIGVKSGKITTAQAISHLTDGLTGTAVMALGWLLSRLGVLSIVGGDGDDEDYDKYRRNLGDYQYMMSIGDVNFDLSGISPIVFPLFMGAAIDEVSENGLPHFESADDLFTVLAQVADPLTEMSMLSGVNTVLEDIAYAGDDGAISTVVRSALSSVAQQFIPTPIGQLERTFDQYSRSYNVSGKGWLGKSASYTAKAIQNKTPFAALSEPSIDLHGEEVKNFSGFGSFLLNLYNQNIAPITVRVDRKDETDAEIMRVYEATLDTGVVPQKPNRSLGYVTDAYGETITFTLTDSEYTEYQKELGQAIYAQLRLVMANESYATLDDDKKAQVLSNVISTVTSETRKQWKQMKIEQAAADGTLRTKKTP